MEIRSTRLRSQEVPRAPKPTKEKLTMPCDSADLTPESEWPKPARLALAGLGGAAGGAALGGLAGVVGMMFEGAKDVVYNTATANSGLVASTAIAGAALGAGFSLLMSSLAQRDEARERNAFREFCGANNVGQAQSPTFRDWNVINKAGWTERQTIPEKSKPALTNILQDLAERGLECNATNPQEALLKLEQRKLKVEGTKVKHISDLQNVDALKGGGLIVLSEEKRATIDTLGSMHNEGFQFLRVPDSTSASRVPFHEAYESIKFSDTDATGHGFFLRNPLGNIYNVKTPEALSVIHTLDGEGDSPLPPLAKTAKQLQEVGIQVGLEQMYETRFSSSAYGAYLNLQSAGDITDIRFDGIPLAVNTESRDESITKLTDWGLNNSVGSFQAFADKMTHEASRQITPKLIESSDSLDELQQNIEIAINLFDNMNGSRAKFFLPKKLPNGYSSALAEILSDR